jgi:hypothetical protein
MTFNDNKTLSAEDDFEIGDIENFNNSDVKFSHSILVMKCFNKCIELGSKELIKGYWETVVDNRGNTKVVYKEDSRRSYIEGVKSLMGVMICDYDETAKTKIKELKDKIKLRFDYWNEQENKWWNKLSYNQKQNYQDYESIISCKDMLHPKLPFTELFQNDELDIYREVLEELSLLTRRLGFYASEKNTA